MEDRMPLFKKLATLATAAAAARTYAKKNPDKASKYVDQAAEFVDKQTKGKYHSQIVGVAQKAKSAAGIERIPGAGPAGNGYVADQSYPPPASTPPASTPPGSTPPGSTQPGSTYPGTPTP
jgi:MT0933-like antitoxin protein